MYRATIHLAVGTRASAHSVTAPGRAEAREVLADFAHAAGYPDVLVDDRVVPDPWTPWSSWSRQHSVACLGGGISPAPADGTNRGSSRLFIRRGPDSGFCFDVPRGTWSCGRGRADVPIADPYLSRRGVQIESAPQTLTVDGAEVRSGPVRVGTTEFAAVGDAPVPEPRDIAWPRLAEPAPPSPPTWIAFAAPIVLGIVLAVVMRMWWFLLFSASAPLTAWLTWRVGVRRHRRECVEALRAHRRAVRAAVAELRQAADQCLAAAEATVRSRTHLRIGRGRVALPAQVVFPDGRPPPISGGSDDSAGTAEITPEQVLPDAEPCSDRARIGEPDPLRVVVADAPLFAEASSPLDVSGDSAHVAGVARSIAHQLLSQGRRIVWDGTDLPPELTGWMTAAADARDEDVVLSLSSDSGHAVLRVRTAHSIDETAELTAEVGGCPRISAATRETRAPVLGAPLSGPAEIHTVSPASFIRILRSAGVRPPEGSADDTAPDLPDLIPLTTRRPLRAAIGSSPQAGAHPGEDVVFADLAESGPHALVAGTTGSGKSVLLRTWISSLMAVHSPEELRFVLLDFKGGAAFAPFAASAHTDALLTDLDRAGAARAVTAVRAEVTRRERVLAASGSDDIDAHNRNGSARLPHLVVVIDELHVIASSDPTVIADIESLTALGRSLGIHLILATQRPAGVITAQMRANISLRICLRVRDESESRDVIDVPDAASLPASFPGAAVIADAAGRRRFRCAMPTAGEAAITIRRLGEEAPPTAIPVETRSAVDDLPQGGPAHEVVLPPLPASLTGGSASALGIVDRPDMTAQPTWRLESCGSAVVIGRRGSGKTSALARIAEAAVAVGEAVVVLCSAGDSRRLADARCPHTDRRGFLTLAPEALWALDYLIAHARTSGRAVRWIVDDWESSASSAETAAPMRRLEEALTSGQCGRFAVAAHRRILSQPIGTLAEAKLLLSPADPDDAVYFGLARGRFPADMPPGRAVLRAPGVAAERDGADVQTALPSAPLVDGNAEPEAGHPLWAGFRPQRASPDGQTAGALIGHGPCGEEIRWATGHGDDVLVVRAQSADDATAFADAWANAAGGCPVLDDPTGTDAAVLAECLHASAPCIVVLPFHRAGRPSQFDRGNDLGPVVLIGARTESDLLCGGRRGLGILPDLEPTDDAASGPRLAWFLTHDSSTPIRLVDSRVR